MAHYYTGPPDRLAGFNAEQRAYAFDQDRALDFEIEMRCECGEFVSSGQMAAHGACEACRRVDMLLSRIAQQAQP